MDSESLRTASTYLNNLLLARGLLRNGDPIDFVKPSKDSRAQIINLVHDLILREDRDKEQREHVAFTMRHMRAEETRQAADIERLTLKCSENARKAAAAEAAERAAGVECKKVEKAMKNLQEQTAKLKTQLAQVRTQCTNDVRRRDLELQRLKTHLQGQQRGNKVGMQAPSITMSGGKGRGAALLNGSVHELTDPEYSLKQETTEFLTQLSQSLSDENDNLIGLIRQALTTMQELLGLPANQRPVDSALGSHNSSSDDIHHKQSAVMPINALPTSYETLAADLEGTLSHLKNILTNPNFVPLSEVEEREEEIVRLRHGWEHMERRWKEVLLMMESWRRKMTTGNTINLDDLRQGLGLVSPQREDNADHFVGQLSEIAEESYLANGEEASEIEIPATTEGYATDDASDAGPTPARNTAAIKSPLSKRKRDPFEPPDFFDLRPPTSHSAAAPSASKSTTTSPRRKAPRSPVRFESEVQEYSDVRLDALDDELANDDEDANEGAAEEEEAPHLTVQQKLEAAQREAEQAAQAAKAQSRSTRPSASKIGRKSPQASAGATAAAAPHSDLFSPVRASGVFDGSIDELQLEGDGDTLGKMMTQCSPMARKTRIRGRPKRRKSTLSREELEALVLCANGAGADDDDDEMF